MDDSVHEARRSAGGSRLRAVAYPRAERHPRHAHPESCITLILRGGFVERVGRDEVTATPLTVLVKPGGVVHADTFAADTRTLQIYLSAIDEAALGAGGELRAWREETAGEPARAMLALGALVTTGAAAATESVFDDRLVEIVAALRPRPDRRPESAPAWLRRAREALREPGATIREAAGTAGVHPVHLARRFRLAYGESPTAFRSRDRLRRAAALVAGERGTLAEVAAAAGYADQAHMTRDLSRSLGMTPQAFRALARSLPAGCVRSRHDGPPVAS